VDVGFDNPVFAMIELEYNEADNDPSGLDAWMFVRAFLIFCCLFLHVFRLQGWQRSKLRRN
jgi:hypothetical protein